MAELPVDNAEVTNSIEGITSVLHTPRGTFVPFCVQSFTHAGVLGSENGINFQRISNPGAYTNGMWK
jgi:hypothetical protein